MADMGENIRTTIAASTAMLAAFPDIAAPVACTQDVIEENGPLPRIWYGLTTSNEDVDLDGSGGMADRSGTWRSSATARRECQSITAVLKRFLNGKRGTFGTQTGGWIVTDHDDEYVPKNLGSEEGYCVAAIRSALSTPPHKEQVIWPNDSPKMVGTRQSCTSNRPLGLDHGVHTDRREVGRLDRKASPENAAVDSWHRGAIVQIERIVRKEREGKVSPIGRIESDAAVQIVRPV